MTELAFIELLLKATYQELCAWLCLHVSTPGRVHILNFTARKPAL